MTRRGEPEVKLVAWLALGLALASLFAAIMVVHTLQTYRHSIHPPVTSER
jgi:hypothetical protein